MRLKALQSQTIKRDTLLEKLGAAKHDAGRAASLIKVDVSKEDPNETKASFKFELNRDKLRQVMRREGRYLLRTNLQDYDPEQLWTFCHPID